MPDREGFMKEFPPSRERARTPAQDFTRQGVVVSQKLHGSRHFG